MSILALDLSKRSTGWAYWEEGQANPAYGSWTLGSEFTTDGAVFAKLHRNMADLRKLCRFEHIVFEQPLRPDVLQGFTNIETLRVLAGLAAHVESFGAAMRVRSTQPIHMASWRRHFLGKMARGTKTKTLKEYARERCLQYGWKTRNDDEADAIGLLDYAISTHGLTPPWSANEVLRQPLTGAAS